MDVITNMSRERFFYFANKLLDLTIFLEGEVIWIVPARRRNKIEKSIDIDVYSYPAKFLEVRGPAFDEVLL